MKRAGARKKRRNGGRGIEKKKGKRRGKESGKLLWMTRERLTKNVAYVCWLPRRNGKERENG